MNEPLTEQQMRALLDEYIAPFYNLVGSALAVLMLFAVFYIIIWPFIKRVGR